MFEEVEPTFVANFISPDGDTCQLPDKSGSKHRPIDQEINTNTSSEPNRSSGSETDPVAFLSTEYYQQRERYYRTVANVGRHAADAIQHAHQFGIVHRDIKPSNLLLDLAGKVWVADFGLAQFHDEHSLTASGDMLGTLRYMSPERLETDGIVDHRCDVYSLGVTLYELALGRQAMTGDSREQIIRRILNKSLPASQKIDPGFPGDLETIIQKATSRSADSRYASSRFARWNSHGRGCGQLPPSSRQAGRIPPFRCENRRRTTPFSYRASIHLSRDWLLS